MLFFIWKQKYQILICISYFNRFQMFLIGFSNPGQPYRQPLVWLHYTREQRVRDNWLLVVSGRLVKLVAKKRMQCYNKSLLAIALVTRRLPVVCTEDSDLPANTCKPLSKF